MATKKQQIADQALKGAIVGVVAYVLAKCNVDAEAQAAIIPLVTAGLAYASTRVGDPGAASFLSKIAKEAPEVVEESTKKAAAKKMVAKKTDAGDDADKPVKKAVAKKA